MDTLGKPTNFHRRFHRRNDGLMVPSKTSITPGFTPADLTDVSGWWDFSETSTLTTATGYSQIDCNLSSGQNLAQATGANQPTSTTLNGLNAASFDTTDDMFYNISDKTQPYSLWVVLKLHAAHATNHKYFGDTGAEALLFSQVSKWALSTFSGNVYTSAIATDTNPHLFIGVFNGASSIFALDGTVVSSVSLSAKTLATLTLGGTGAQHGDFDCGEAGYTRGAMTLAEIADMQAYSQAKWGTA